MRHLITIIILFSSITAYSRGPHYPTPWVKKLCSLGDKRIICLPYIGSKSISWFEFAESNQLYARGLMKLNRRDTTIWKNHVVAVAWPLEQMNDELAFSPFPDKTPKYIPNKTVVVDLNNLAWGAYDEIGNLVRWSLISAGKGTIKKFETPSGIFKVLEKRGAKTRSNLYPTNCRNKSVCGFLMPYYIKIDKNGLGLHGAKILPGFHASHGCIRLLIEDAKWLNQKFLDIGTSVIISPNDYYLRRKQPL